MPHAERGCPPVTAPGASYSFLEYASQVNDEASERVLEVEREFNKKRRPLYLERNQIIRNIPHFWLTVFLSHNDLSALLTTEDSEVLSFLIAVRITEALATLRSAVFVLQAAGSV